MSSLPHSRLLLGENVTVVTSGSHIQIIDSKTGKVIQSTVNFEGTEKEAIVKAGPIRCVDVDVSFTHLVTSGEDKQLKVWRLEDLKLLSERELPKKPTDVHFTRDGKTILVSDKFGDIFSYPLEHEPTLSENAAEEGDAKPRNQILSHENPSGGTLILGHTSLLTSFLLTEDEQFVVSADRDEHIRVSWYPQGYVIERFCLGHKKFVHTVHIPKFAPSVLVSAGGDPVVKLWDWMSGELLCDIRIGEVVEPFIQVRAPKGKWGWNEGEGGGEPRVGKRGRRKGKGKGKGKSKGGEDEDNEAEEADEKVVTAQELEGGEGDVEMNDAGGEGADETVTPTSKEPKEDLLVLVVHRVASVDIPGQGQFLLFNAVGATALFYCSFPSDPKSSDTPAVRSLQLDKPVIDFTIDAAGRVWALVDGERESGSPAIQSLVRLLGWSSGQLVEEAAAEEVKPLLDALNSSCKIPATSEDIKALDIYSALSSMPKHVDPEHDPFEGTTSREPAEEHALGKRKAKERTQREQARMKKKQAVLAKLQEHSQATGSRDASASVPPEDGRDAKKVKPVGIDASL